MNLKRHVVYHLTFNRHVVTTSKIWNRSVVATPCVGKESTSIVASVVRSHGNGIRLSSDSPSDRLCEFAMEDLPLQKIALAGPILASLIQRFSSSHGAVDGLLFGHVAENVPQTLSDDSPSADNADSLTRVATITGFLCTGTVNSFYDSSGRVDSPSLKRLINNQHSLLGWFSGRRKSQLRPSMREFLVTASLSSEIGLSFPVRTSNNPTNFSPCVFLLFASPLIDQTVNTHEYRGYQFRSSTESFEPKSIDIVNIGPAFRGHYESFSPNSMFPDLPFELRASPMNEDMKDDRLSRMKQISKDQKELDFYAGGYEIGNLNKLIGSEAANYTARLEDLYEKMLTNIETLARLVEKSSAKVLEQENHVRKLRYKAARIPGVE